MHIDIKRYKSIVKACDYLIHSEDASFEQISIPWLHVIRPHPIFLNDYLRLSQNQYYLVIDFIGYIAVSFFRAFSSLFKKNVYAEGDLEKQTDVLILSHLINVKFAGAANDFYFGNLANAIQSSGINSTIALINHTNAPPNSLRVACGADNISRVILTKSLGFLNELKLFARALGCSTKLLTRAHCNSESFKTHVMRSAAVESIKSRSIQNLRFGEQVKYIVAKLKPKIIITTFEGHAWERVAFFKARESNPKIKCIGYQHAPIFCMQHSILRDISIKYDPDVILTSGDYYVNFFRNKYLTSKPLVATLGSNRFIPVNKTKDNVSKNYTCLVLPEGFTSEAKILFDFSLECAKTRNDINFILRLHPGVDYRKFLESNIKYRKLPPNVTISSSSLEEDIKRSTWALYRGSSSVTQAVIAGLKPIYLEIESEISLDLFHNLRESRFVVSKPEEYINIVEGFSNASYDFKKLKDVCNAMCMPFNPDIIIDIYEKKAKSIC